MRKVFWDNPYQTELESKVTNVNGNELLFDQTIIFSFCGGQENDKATINGMPVLASRMDGNLIYYTLTEGHNLKVDDQVTMLVDWERRNRLMRLHFAAELILEIVTQKWGYQKVGAHIAETKSRIDFKADTNVSTHFEEILKVYNEIIAADKPIEKGFTDVATQRRYWKIDGFSQVPCGGTHVKTTGEVGYVMLKRDRPGKGIERIEIRLVDDTSTS